MTTACGRTGTTACAIAALAACILFSCRANAEPAASSAAAFASAHGSLDPLSLDYLESVDAVVGDIVIRNGDVFDTSDPAESGAFYRIINALHMETGADVIRRQLLIESGAQLNASEIAEAERMLRANAFLRSATIRPIAYANGEVDLEVITEDTWSLSPSLSFSRKGGTNTGGFELEEKNLLGTGSEIKLGYKSTIERDETFFGYHDVQLGSSRLELGLELADNSDGSAQKLLLQQPFYGLDTHSAGGIRIDLFEQVDPWYQLGKVIDETGHVGRRAEVFYGWSDGLVNGRVQRLSVGLGYDVHKFSGVDGKPPRPGTPADRRDIYPFVAWEHLEDRYETTRNADNIHRVEDRYIGMRLAAKLGYAATAFGSGDDAWLYAFEAERGFKPTESDTLMLFGRAEGRSVTTQPDSFLAETGTRWYHRQTPRRLLYSEVRFRAGEMLDPDEQVVLGGDTGLRGYPARYQAGDYEALLTLEQRFYTDYYPFRLFRVGAAAFFDAGRVWNTIDGPSSDLGLLRDIGLGLRIGSPRSSTGRMVHIDLAWPLDGPEDIKGAQLIIETSKSF